MVQLNKNGFIAAGTLISILAVLALAIFLVKHSKSVKANNDIRADVEQEEYIMGPGPGIPDNAYFGVQTTGGVRTYSANGNTTTLFGPDLNSQTSEGIALAKGGAGNFDECGAWLQSVYKLDESHWIGWYHAEDQCDYANGITHKSMAFTESTDKGKTWNKPNYPNNRILTADTTFDGDLSKDDAGDGKVIKVGDYFYLFYRASSDWLIHIARSSVTDQGKPGTWYKFYNGGYTEPGIGGHESGLTNISGAFVVNSSYLGRYVTGIMTGKWGLNPSLSLGSDFLNWERFPGGGISKSIFPPVSTSTDPLVDDWSNRDASSKQLYGYTSFIAPSGDSDNIDQTFYIYYMKLFNGEGFDKRYLMRRKITLVPKDSAVYAKNLLTRYEKLSPKKTKVSIEIAKPSEGYSFKQNLGYVLPYQEAGFHPVYECFITAWNDYFLSKEDPATSNWQNCEDSTGGDVFIRRIGWLADSATAEASVPLYRCFDSVNKDHFASTDPNCEGNTTEFILGYMMPIPVAPTPTPTPTPTPIPTPTPTPDTIVPTVSITSPANNSQVSRNSTVTITANASDNVGIAKVEFYVNNTLKCTDTTTPYTCNWQVPGQKNKTYNLVAKAYDAANNIGTSTTVTVTAK